MPVLPLMKRFVGDEAEAVNSFPVSEDKERHRFMRHAAGDQNGDHMTC